MKKPELLSPAGDFEKLRCALDYGADAVYAGAGDFSLRRAGTGFTAEELIRAVDYVRSAGKKIYLAVNAFQRIGDIERLEAFLPLIREAHADAYIVSDLGAARLIRKHIRDPVLHLSTQASVTNHESARAYHELGFQRIVLARELSLAEIRHIRENTPPDLELEVFVHGAMCLSYSGQCLLSPHFTGRDANRGDCAQPCRWEYTAREKSRPGDPLTVSGDGSGSYLFSSRDLCMIEHLPDLAACGIDCFKIEGRVKSAYYAAVCSNAYRMAIDGWFADPENYAFDRRLLGELESVSHREYSTGFFFAEPGKPLVNTDATRSSYIKERSFLALADGYGGQNGRALLTQKNKFNAGDTVEVLTPGRFGEKTVIRRMFDENMNEIQSCPRPRQRFYVESDRRIDSGDILRAGE